MFKTLGYDEVKDLIETKQAVLREEIRRISVIWQKENAEIFVDRCKKGIIKECEHDAILVTNFLDELKSIESLDVKLK